MSNPGYGVIGNGRTAALVSRDGSIDWLCFPDFDSPSVFSKIMDDFHGGNFGFTVTDDYEIIQSYEDGSNVMRTRFDCGDHCFEVTDFMPLYRTDPYTHYMPPEIYRYIRVVRGCPEITVVYDPVMNYARERVAHRKFPSYILSSSPFNEQECLYLYTSFDFDDVLSRRRIELRGENFLMLSYYQKLFDVDVNRVYLEYERTMAFSRLSRSPREPDYFDELTYAEMVYSYEDYEFPGPYHGYLLDVRS